jgi:hypothetical protein
MKDQITFERETMVRSYRQAFLKSAWRRRIFLASGVWIGVSVTGITALNFYRELWSKTYLVPWTGQLLKVFSKSQYVYQKSWFRYWRESALDW